MVLMVVLIFRLSSTTETLLVEPHYINLLFTPLTNEFLAQVYIYNFILMMNLIIFTILMIKLLCNLVTHLSCTKNDK